MPRPKLNYNRADVRALWELMEKMGQEPVSAKVHPDGTFRIMTRKQVEARYGATSEPTGNPWDQVFGHASV